MSDDLIRRSDAIEAYSDIYWIDDRLNLAFREELDKIDEKIRNIPIVEVVDRPQGEWIDAEIPLESGGSMPIQVCNLCKTFYPLAYTGGGHRFCPNCGADMRGKDDED